MIGGPGAIDRKGRFSSPGMFRAGFTLMELLLVIALIAVLAGVTVPVFRYTAQGFRIRSTASTLAETIRYARSTSVTRSVRGKLQFVSQPPAMALEMEDDPLQAPGTYNEIQLPHRMQDVLGKGIKHVDVKEKTATGFEETDTIEFFPDGRCTDTFLYLYGEDDSVHTVAVVGISGQVMLFEGEVDSYYGQE